MLVSGGCRWAREFEVIGVSSPKDIGRILRQLYTTCQRQNGCETSNLFHRLDLRSARER
jgi:hypothetical protein